MAICLNDVKKKKISVKPKSLEFKDKIVRPWETFDDQSGKTRTVSAKEAVFRARQIVGNNEQLVEKLRNGCQGTDYLWDLDRETEKMGPFISDENPQKVLKIKRNNTFFSFVRDIFDFS